MLHKLLFSILTDALVVILLLGLIGLVNRAFRKPFLDRWRRNLPFFITFMLGSNIFDFSPAEWHLPMAVVGGLLLLAVMVWLIQQPGAGSNRT